MRVLTTAKLVAVEADQTADALLQNERARSRTSPISGPLLRSLRPLAKVVSVASVRNTRTVLRAYERRIHIDDLRSSGKVAVIGSGVKNLGGIISQQIAGELAKVVVHCNNAPTPADADKTVAAIKASQDKPFPIAGTRRTERSPP